MNGPDELDRVRAELQRLGYLSHRFERLLLQDALVPRRAGGALVGLAAKIGVLAGSALAVVNALALAAANGTLAASPGDLLPLFAHVWVPLAAACGVGFLAVAALFLAALRQLPRRRLEPVRLGVAIAATALLTGAGIVRGWPLLAGLSLGERAVAALAIPLVAAAIAKLLADGLLAFEVRLTRWTPAERTVSRRALAAAIAVSIGVVALLALLLPAARRPAPPASLPEAAGERVLLVGIDGVLPDEIDYLLGREDLPELSRLARAGGVVAGYARAADATPAAFWTTVATGVEPELHGVVSLDSYRPRGVATPLARSGPWRLWFERIEAPLRLAEYRPLLAHRRRAPAVWELAARGGTPVAAIDWWASYPAAPLPGLVVAHGAFQLLARDAAGAVEPATRRGEMAALARTAEPGPFAGPLAAALPAAAAREALARAVLPDRFYRAAAERAAALAPKVAALYLPAIDLLADGWSGPPEALAELVRLQLVEVDALVGRLAPGVGTILVVFDPGRRGGGEGRALVWRGACGAESRPRLDPREVGAAALRAAGLPQSDEVPEPPAFCPWPAPPARVPTYGERTPAPRAAATGDEYLESLRSLGYL